VSARQLITEHLDLWTGAVTKKSSSGRGSNGKVELTGVKRLRELILELAVRGRLVHQDQNEEPAALLAEKIATEKAALMQAGAIKKSPKLPEISPDEIPFDIPNGWHWIRLGELVKKIGSGATPRGGKNAYVQSGIPFLRSQNIWNDGLNLQDVAYIPPETHERMANTHVFPNDILLNITGASLGRCTVVPTELEMANVSQHVTIIRTIDPLNRSYLHYLILSPYVQSLVWGRQVGMAREGLSKKVLEQFEIPLPPLEEQHRIVQKVDELMALCDRLEQQTSDQLEAHETLVDTLLGTLTQSENATELADNWARLAAHFDTLLVEPDAGDEPAAEVVKRAHEKKAQLLSDKLIKKQKELPDITEPEKPFSIPPLWAFARLDDICTEVTSGSTPPKSEFSETSGIPYLKVYNIRSQRVDFDYKSQFVTENYHRTTLKRSQLLPGDVVMNIVGPPLGKTAIIPNDHPEWNCNQAIVRFRPIEIELNQFIHLYLKAGMFLKTIELIGTAGQDNISVTKSRSIVIPLPPKAEQHRIVQKVDELMALCDQLKERLNQASETRCQLAEAVVEGALT